jgi:hypothetical protein
MGLKALIGSLLGKKSSPTGSGEILSPVIVHTIHRDVDLPRFCRSLEPGSVHYIEFLTVPPWWDGMEIPEFPDGFTAPLPGSYSIAVVDVPSSRLPRGRHQFASTFYADDGRQCTKRWSAEGPWCGRFRALLMVPAEAVRCETKVMDGRA